MKISFNGATTMKADLATDIRAAAAAGFRLPRDLGGEAAQVSQNTIPPTDLEEAVRRERGKPLSINSIEHITFRDAAAYARIRAECEELCAIAEAIKCPYMVVVPGQIPSGRLEKL